MGIPRRQLGRISRRRPSQKQILGFLDRVEPKVKKWLLDCPDAAYLAPENDFLWTGGTRLDHALYSLRHAQHHLGQINAELRHKNLPRGEWA